MEEKPYQFLGKVRNSWAMRPGDDKKVNFEYKRNEIGSIFVFGVPLGGRYHVNAREHRTAIDWTEEIKYLVDEMYLDVEM